MGMLWFGCSSGGGSPSGSGGTQGSGSGGSGSGGTTSSSGGSSGSGGATSSGGKTGSGGTPSSGSGGSSSGGTTGSGGKASSGGATGSGGTTASGGTTGSGGAGTATGGAAAGTGGASAGGATGSGGGGGAASGPVTPTMSGTTYSFSSGDLVFQIDASTGGRVSKLALSGSDIIMTTATDPTTWGSVFWTSPRSNWPGTMWPPPANIDSAAYTAMISGTHVTAMGMVEPTLMVSMSKDYSMDSSGLITLSYKINAQKALMAAPWEVSRVPRGGLAFFPVASTSSVTKGPWTIMTTTSTPNSVVWIDDSAKTATSPDGDKLIADGAEGWEAYAINGNLFLKLYTDTPASMFAPMEGEIGVYPGDGFVEFEVQGAYTAIATGASLPYTTHWKVVKIPSGTTVSAGSSTLLSFARQQATM